MSSFRTINVSMEAMFKKLPPQSRDSEAAVIGCMVDNPACVGDIRRIVTPEDFHDQTLSGVYSACLRVYDRTKDCDPIVVADECLKADLYHSRDEAVVAVDSCANATPSAVGWNQYCQVVLQKSRLRKLITLCGEAVYLAYTAPDDDTSTISQLFERVSVLARGGTQNKTVMQREAFEMVLADMEKGRAANIRTGLYDFDLIAGGVPRSVYCGISGRFLLCTLYTTISARKESPLAQT